MSKTIQSVGLMFLAASVIFSSSVFMPAFAAETAAAPQIIEYTLPSGQSLYIKPDHTQPIVTIDTWVRTGSVNETTDINGVSHFLEHLLFKGTTNHKPGEIERILESKGAEFNAATSDDFTHYYTTTATPYFTEALKLHADMLLNANFPKAELDRERLVVQEEINRATDNPERQLYIEMSKLLYGSHGYALDTLGPKENIAKIPREKIMEYYHYWYQPQNFSTVIVGDVKPEQVKALVAQYFPTPNYGKPDAYKAPAVGTPAALIKPQSSVKSDPTISQAYLTLSFIGPAIAQAEDTYALDIAMNALGAGKSSRLYSALVERKRDPLALTVSASNITQKHSGMLAVQAQMKPENVDAVKREIIAQIQQLKTKGITQDELAKAKTQYLKDFVFLNETTDGVAQSVGYNVTIGTLKDYTDYVAEIQKITTDDVQKAATKYLNFNQAVIMELLPKSAAQSSNLEQENNANLALLQNANTTNTIASLPTQTVSAADTAIEKLTLANGMHVILKPNPASETVAIKLFVQGGQASEKAPGVASLTSQLLTQGTLSRSAERISQELESKGMSLSVSATEDYLEISGDAVKTDIGELFLVIQDILNHSTYSEQELNKQKELLRQSILVSRDNPSALAFEKLSLSLYPNHPYGNVGQRIESNLPKIGRDDILTYANTHLKPQNILAVVVGNFKSDTMQDYLSALFPSAPTVQATAAATQKPQLAPVRDLAKNEEVLTQKDKQAATWIAKGWLVPAVNNTDYVPLKVLNSLLGTGMSSRLFVNLREKQGLAYVVSSFYPSRAQKSRFVLYIGTDPKNYTQVEKNFQKEIDRLKVESVSSKELQDAKDKLAGSFALAHETNANQAYYLGLFEILGVGYQYDTQYPKMIQQVTSNDLLRVAKKYFSQPSVTSVVKPKEAGANKS